MKKDTYIKGLTAELDNPNRRIYKINGIEYDYDGLRVLINRGSGVENE